MTERYQSVNGAWPEAVPPLTKQEAITAVKRLYRLEMGRPVPKWWKFKIVTGNRRTVFWTDPVTINLVGHPYFKGNGWASLVHSLSHHVHHRKFPKHKPHDGRGTHAFIEKTMIEHVVNSGWLEGKIKRPEKSKAPVDIKATRHKRVLERMAAWSAKRKRAETALRKLNRQRIYYERQLSA